LRIDATRSLFLIFVRTLLPGAALFLSRWRSRMQRTSSRFGAAERKSLDGVDTVADIVAIPVLKTEQWMRRTRRAAKEQSGVTVGLSRVPAQSVWTNPIPAMRAAVTSVTSPAESRSMTIERMPKDRHGQMSDRWR
jgi:hypothetical protein